MGIVAAPSTLRASVSPATAGRGWLKIASPPIRLAPRFISFIPLRRGLQHFPYGGTQKHLRTSASSVVPRTSVMYETTHSITII
jgi:hypothetical protein